MRNNLKIEKLMECIYSTKIEGFTSFWMYYATKVITIVE
jgi:hypothetical protein